MNDSGSQLFRDVEHPFSSITWDVLTSEQRLRGSVTKISCLVDSLPGLLIVERCDLRMPAESSLARLQMMHMRLSGISSVVPLEDVPTPLGTFVRRRFELAPHNRRRVFASAANSEVGLDVVVQFVVLRADQEEGVMESLSRLSISKALELDG